MRKAKVYMYEHLAGLLSEDEDGYHFIYYPSYLSLKNPEPISLTLPLSEKPHNSKVIFSFFDGLIPEGVNKNAKMDKSIN